MMTDEERKKALESEWPVPKNVTERRQLDTINKRTNLNTVLAVHDEGEQGDDSFAVYQDGKLCAVVQMQSGPRFEEGSTEGATEADLLEMVRDRLQRFQQGKYACRENALAITAIEEALLWMMKRSEDRFNRSVLGQNKE